MTESSSKPKPPNPDRWPFSAVAIVGGLLIVTLASLAVAFSSLNDNSESPQDSIDQAEAVEAGSDLTPQDTYEFGQVAQVEARDTTLEIRPEEFFSSLTPAYVDVDPGQKLVGALINFRNAGEQQYSTSAWQDVMLVDSDSRQWPVEGLPDEAGPCGPRLESMNLTPGLERKGCFPFTLPKDVEPEFLQVTPDAGSSQNFAIWIIPDSE